MQPASFANLDLLERNLFLLESDLTRGLDVTWVCNTEVFFPKKSPCAPLPHPFGGGTRSGHPAIAGEGVWQAVSLPFIPPLEQFWVSLMIHIPDFLIRKIEFVEEPDPSTPEMKSQHSRTGPRDKLRPAGKGGAGRLVPVMDCGR